MLEEGYYLDYIRRKFGINYERLHCLWLQYQEYDTSDLHRNRPRQTKY